MVKNKKLQEYPETLYAEGSPVAVSKMQLCYSTDYGVNVLCITFRNISILTMYGLSIVIEPKDKRGDLIREGIIEYNYYGIEVPFNKIFGANEEIVMESEAVSFNIRVIRADFSNGATFHGDIELEPLPEQKKVEEMEEIFREPFLKTIAEKKPKLIPKFIPERKPEYWRCTCGRVYPIDSPQCKSCYLERDWITGLYPGLVDERKRLEAEKEEQKRREEEEIRRSIEEEKIRLAEEEARILEEERIKEEAARQAEEREILKRLEEEAEINRKKEEEKERRKKMIILITVCVLAATGIVMSMKALLVKKQTESELDALRQMITEQQTEIPRMVEEPTTQEPEPQTQASKSQETPGFSFFDESGRNITGTAISELYYRTDPSMEADIIDTIGTGETFQILGQIGEWYYVSARDTTGYVYIYYVNATVK